MFGGIFKLAMKKYIWRVCVVQVRNHHRLATTNLWGHEEFVLSGSK
jgi:hypothetical protein